MNNGYQGNTGFEGLQRVQIKELIARACEGSAAAFDELKNSYKPLIESQISKHTAIDMNAQDIEDLRQEALVIFCNAVCNYDCSVEGVEFGLFAKICIENGLVSYVRSYVRRKKNAVIPLDGLTKAPCAGSDLLQTLVDKETLSDLVHTIRKNLSDYENRVWWLYFSGMSVSDIAVALGGDPKSVSNAIYRIRKKLRSLIDGKQ